MWRCGRLSWSIHTHTHTYKTYSMHRTPSHFQILSPAHSLLPSLTGITTDKHAHKWCSSMYWCIQQDFHVISALLLKTWHITVFSESTCTHLEFSGRCATDHKCMTFAVITDSVMTAPRWAFSRLSLQCSQGMVLTPEIHKSTVRHLVFSEAGEYSLANFLFSLLFIEHLPWMLA